MSIIYRRVAFLMCTTFIYANSSFAAGKKPSIASSMAGDSASSSSKDYLLSMPIVAETPQIRPHIEINISNEFTLALEGGLLAETEQLSKEELMETGNSLKVKGAQATLLLSRYSEPERMAGFFWSLGGGYRKFTADWKKQPGDNTTQTQLASINEDGYLRHRVNGTGTTAHFRLGYRYVADSWPVAIGGHVGFRHMNSSLENAKISDSEKNETQLTHSPLSETEEKSVKHRMMTTPDLAVEIGLIL